MNFTKEHGIEPGKSLRLDSIPTKEKGPFADKDEAMRFTARVNRRSATYSTACSWNKNNRC